MEAIVSCSAPLQVPVSGWSAVNPADSHGYVSSSHLLCHAREHQRWTFTGAITYSSSQTILGNSASDVDDHLQPSEWHQCTGEPPLPEAASTHTGSGYQTLIALQLFQTRRAICFYRTSTLCVHWQPQAAPVWGLGSRSPDDCKLPLITTMSVSSSTCICSGRDTVKGSIYLNVIGSLHSWHKGS